MKQFATVVVAFMIIAIFSVFNAGCKEELPVISDTTSPIEVEVGQEFAIALESNQTTGYRWQFAKPLDTTILEFKGAEYKMSEGERVGEGGQEIWMFKAIGQGTTMIVFKYVRPWERDLYPLRSRTFIVIVQMGSSNGIKWGQVFNLDNCLAQRLI